MFRLARSSQYLAPYLKPRASSHLKPVVFTNSWTSTDSWAFTNSKASFSTQSDPESSENTDGKWNDTQDGSLVADLTQKMLQVGLFGHETIWFSGSESLADNYRGAPGEKLTLDQTDQLINTETWKAGGVGFITGVAGIIALPIGLPAALTGSWILQTRLAGAIASGQHYDLYDPEVQTKVLISLMGGSVSNLNSIQDPDVQNQKLLQKFSREFGTARLPLALLGQVQRLVVREVAKHATKRGAGAVAGRALPGAGGLVGGVIDATSIQKVGGNAQKLFM